MAKERDETSTLTNKRSEAPTLLDEDVPSSKKLTTTSADLSSISSQEEAPPAVGVVDNITETPIQSDPVSSDPYEEEAPQAVSAVDNITETLVQSDPVSLDPYKLTPLDLGDQLEELEDDEIKFTYKTVFMGDTTGLVKAMDAKLDDIKRLELDYDYVFKKIKEAQSETQGNPKSLVTVYWCNNRVGYIIAGVLMEDRWS